MLPRAIRIRTPGPLPSAIRETAYGVPGTGTSSDAGTSRCGAQPREVRGEFVAALVLVDRGELGRSRELVQGAGRSRGSGLELSTASSWSLSTTA